MFGYNFYITLEEKNQQKGENYPNAKQLLSNTVVQLSIDQEELIADLIATYGSEIISITNKIFSKIINKKREDLY